MRWHLARLSSTLKPVPRWGATAREFGAFLAPVLFSADAWCGNDQTLESIGDTGTNSDHTLWAKSSTGKTQVVIPCAGPGFSMVLHILNEFPANDVKNRNWFTKILKPAVAYQCISAVSPCQRPGHMNCIATFTLEKWKYRAPEESHHWSSLAAAVWSTRFHWTNHVNQWIVKNRCLGHS